MFIFSKGIAFIPNSYLLYCCWDYAKSSLLGTNGDYILIVILVENEGKVQLVMQLITGIIQQKQIHGVKVI